MAKAIDLVGQTFARWTVVRQGPRSNGGIGEAQWFVRCECGTEGLVKSTLLRDGRSKSCGCLKRELHAASNLKHGHAHEGKISSTYWSWAGMKARCLNPNHVAYPDYGGRGIAICERWMSFANFLEDMGEKPPGMSLERKRVNEGYNPDNCEWATLAAQAANKRPDGEGAGRRPYVPTGELSRIDLQGQRFGRWLVVRLAVRPNGGQARWLCRCDCGVERSVSSWNLRKGTSKSCGCLTGDSAIERLTKHGHARAGKMTATYKTWGTMRNRCNNPNEPGYHKYGGRGIRVCERWNEFANFLADMGEKPAPGLSIERKDNEGPYEKDNCVWATSSEQARNRRSSRFVTVDGVTKTIAAWSESSGIAQGTISFRLSRGWAADQAVKLPPDGAANKPHLRKRD